MLNKSFVAVSLGAAMAASLPAQAATWTGTTASPIEIGGTISVVSLPGTWEWAVGGKTDFQHDAGVTPLTANAKKITITLTDDLPILAGRITSPILGGSGANVHVSYPDVSVGAGYPGYAIGTADQSITINAPVTVKGQTGTVGVATFNASGAGVTYAVPVDLSSAYVPRAVAPETSTALCAG
ncbi:MAG: hypothetical protein ACRC5D_16015, partial [Aeromonas allosaccharophila]